MKINYKICSILALAVSCFCGVARPQDEAVKMVLDILKGDDQDMQEVADAVKKIQKNAKELA